MTKEQIFLKVKSEIAELLDNYLGESSSFQDDPPAFICDTTAMRMAEAAVAVLQCQVEHEAWLLREGCHRETKAGE